MHLHTWQKWTDTIEDISIHFHATSLKAVMYSFYIFLSSVQAASSQRARICHFINVRRLGNINYYCYAF